jgi:ubiquinone/menaquinone biosynthesis C-methylase UbiE
MTEVPTAHASQPAAPAAGGVSQDLQQLYDGYYANRMIKREITAAQTIGHIRSLWRGGQAQRMLDVGAGEGSLLTHLAQSGLAAELYAVEISGTGVDAISARSVPGLVEVSKFDGYHIPYPDRHFDVACSIHVLEHVEHERMFLKEMARVAKRLIIEVPLEHTLRVKRSIRVSRPFGHINLYTETTFRNLLETTGLEVEAMQVFSNSLEFERCVFGKASGTVKYAIRAGLLKVAPALATSGMTYMCTASCVARP